MKELSIEEKAKCYDEAIKRAKNYYSTTDSAADIKLIGLIFPELKEGEDEKTRKEILDYIIKGSESLYDVQQYGKERFDKWISWLEKQGEHTNFLSKILVGDKVTRNEDGVLVNLSQLKRVAKKDEKQGEQKPAFEMITPEESLGVDSDTYNKIVDECIYGEQEPAEIEKGANGNDREIPNSAWSEEDESMLCGVMETEQYMLAVVNGIEKFDVGNCAIRKACTEELNWLKLLKDRVQHQSTWRPSDEQMEALDDFIYAKYPNTEKHGAAVKSLYQDLKKLKG